MPARRPFRRFDPKLANLFSRVKNAVSTRWSRSDTAPDSIHPVTRAAMFCVDSLEQRLLFHTIGFNAITNTPILDGTYEYFDENKNVIRVAWHDVIAELVGVSVDSKTDIATQSEMITASNPEPTNGVNLFTIYVIQSSLDSYISIAAVPATSDTGPRNMEPFTGSAGPFSVVNAGTGQPRVTYSPAAGSGAALLGATFFGPKGSPFAANQPIVQIQTSPNNALGVYPGDPGLPTDFPAPIGRLTAGLYVTPVKLNPTTGAAVIDPTTGLDEPNDLGRFFFAGTIFGNVSVPAAPAGSVPPAPASQGGNIGVFYAGAILTGDAGGIFQQIEVTASTQPLPFPSGSNFTLTSNFAVGGDIRDLVTDTDIGGNPIGAQVDLSHYFTGFDAVVAGSVGTIDNRAGNLFGTFDAQHLPSVYGLPDSLFTETEYEARTQGGSAGPLFQGTGSLTLLPQLGPPFTNDTIATEQYLGSIKETNPKNGLPLKDVNGNFVYGAEVDGILEGFTPDNEQADNYGISMMAGQTFTTTLTETGEDGLVIPGLGQFLQVQIIDPQGRIVASDENKVSPALTWDQPFSYTADKPGIYTIAVIWEPGVDVIGDIDYHISVQGIGDQGMGVMACPQGNIYDGGVDSAFEVDNGDFGGLLAGAVIASGTLGPLVPITSINTTFLPGTTVKVGNGNLRTMIGASIGVNIGDDAESIPWLVVPNGSVGLLQATDPGGILSVQTQFTNYLITTNPALPSNSITTSPVVASAVGGDFQTIEGAGNVQLAIACNRAIGNILAGEMTTLLPSFIEVNADNVGFDGKIDLIDVTGDLGLPGVGGPGIVTNSGGDVRYIKCGGLIFRDAFFGSADQPDSVIYQPGEVVKFTDDSGTVITLTPTGPVGPNPLATPANLLIDPTIQLTEGPQLAITGYPIRGSGGGVLIDVAVANITATAPTTTAATGTTPPAAIPMEGGLQVSASSNAAGAVTEISRIQIEGNNTTAFTDTGIADANGLTTVTDLPAGTTATTAGIILPALALNITGNVEVDVLDVVVSQIVNPQFYVFPVSTESGEAGPSPTPALGNALSVTNNTPNGELVRVLANSIGTLFSEGTLGVAKHSTPAAVLPQVNLSIGAALVNDGAIDGAGRFSTSAALNIGGTPNITNTNASGDQTGDNLSYPFMLQKTGITVSQSIQNLWANEGLGNVEVDGSIQNISPNLDGKVHPGYFSGIIGPIVGGTFGHLNNISIGQGMISSGTGIFSAAGVYSWQVGSVVGRNADLRGQVESLLNTKSISLHNGSLIDADIIAINERVGHAFNGNALTDVVLVGTYTQGVQFLPGTNAFGGFPIQEIDNPFIELGSISTTGTGGIIGCLIAADDIGAISAAGFGLFETLITTAGTDEIGAVVAGGYGIRGVTIDAGSLIGEIGAFGDGRNLSVATLPLSVRQSEVIAPDPNTGLQVDPNTHSTPTPLSDIDAYLGTSKVAPVINGRTDTGVIEDTVVTASTNLNSLTATIVRTSRPVIDPAAPTTPVIPQPNQPFPMQINIGQKINNVTIGNLIDGLSITTGQLGKFRMGTSVSRLGITVAGVIKSLIIPGNFGQIITDPNTQLPIGDSYINAIGPAGVIDALTINGNLNGNVSATQAILRMSVGGNVSGNITAQGDVNGLTLGTLRIGGSIKNGSLVVQGNAGDITTNGSLGNVGDSLTIAGNLNSLTVGAKRGVGHNLNSSLHVEGTLNKLLVNGLVSGNITVDNDLNSMRLMGIGTLGSASNASFTIGDRLGTAIVSNQNLGGAVSVTGSINSFTLQRGSVLATATIKSDLETIHSFKITGGASFGMLGTLIASNGLNMSIDISGNVGDGIDAANIVALSGTVFHIRGSILTDASIFVNGPLPLLDVDGNINAGATITAHPLGKLKVGGANQGTIVGLA